MIKLDIKEDTDLWEKRLQCLQYLREHQVDVGLTSSAPSRSRFLLAIHEHGAPVMRIPARPVITPGLSRAETKAAMTDALYSAAEAAMTGELSSVVSAFEEAGQAGADGIRAYIDSGISPPNSAVTVSGGWIYNRVARTGVPVSGKGFNKPLYDTGELYNSFSWEITSR